MKLLVGWTVVAAMISATAAGAQPLPPHQTGGSPYYSTVSDIGGAAASEPYASGPYAEMPPSATPPRYAPTVLPPREVYTVLRENGFSPLGAPQQRGVVYTIAVIDSHGDDGRLVIDARNGRIVRFLPAYRMGDRMGDEVTMSYGAPGPLPPISDMDMKPRMPRPPLTVPRVASRSPAPPMRAMPPRAVGEARPPAPAAVLSPPPAPVQQSAIVAPKPAETTALPAAPALVEAKPSVKILPTQEMPKMQGLD